MSERLFRALADKAIDVLLTSQASSDQAISVAVASTDADAAAKAIIREFRFERRQRSITLERQTNQSLIALVGDATVRQQAASDVLATLARHGIEVAAVAEGGRAVPSLRARGEPAPARDQHRAPAPVRFAQAARTRDCGGWDRRQRAAAPAAQQRDTLSARDRPDRRRTRKQPAFSRGAGRDRHQELARDSRDIQVADGSGRFAAEIKHLDLAACAFVDCTASDAIVDAYPEFVNADCHVIAANKRPLVLPVRDYAARRSLRETPAPLPLRSNGRRRTAGHLDDAGPRADGDEIEKLKGVFSGTLSYLFNTFDGTRPFSALVREAHVLGFTEPDPREDLAAPGRGAQAADPGRQTGCRWTSKTSRLSPRAALLARGSSRAFFSALGRYDAEMASG